MNDISFRDVSNCNVSMSDVSIINFSLSDVIMSVYKRFVSVSDVSMSELA